MKKTKPSTKDFSNKRPHYLHVATQCNKGTHKPLHNEQWTLVFDFNKKYIVYVERV